MNKNRVLADILFAIAIIILGASGLIFMATSYLEWRQALDALNRTLELIVIFTQ